MSLRRRARNALLRERAKQIEKELTQYIVAIRVLKAKPENSR